MHLETVVVSPFPFVTVSRGIGKVVVVVRGRCPGSRNRLGTREAHQRLVGGIVRATGPDPFGNGMPLPTYP